MLPHYQLPPKPKAASNINPDFSPDQVGSWLAKLPLSSPLEAAEKLSRFLNAFNRIELPANHRSRLADLLKTGVYHLAERLAQDLVTHPLPLPQTQFQALALSQALLGELAISQKLLILDALSRKQDSAVIAKLLSDLFDCIDKLMAACYQNHTALPSGLWKDLHQSYLCAQQLGIAEVASPHGLSLANTYKAILLLALADPYQFTRQELDWTRSLALNAAGTTQITAANASEKSLAPFCILAEMDDPPQPSTRHYAKAQYSGFFETSAVAKQLAILGNAIRTRRIRPGIELPPEADWPAYSVLLNKLKLRWGASKHRMIQRRKPLQDHQYEVTIGLANICLNTQALPGIPCALCSPINDSAGGLALRHNGNFSMNIEIGEVVGIKQAGSATWRIGLVRWFKQAGANELLFGMQLLGVKAIPASVNLAKGEEKQCGVLAYGSGGKIDCLVLPADTELAGKQLVLDGAEGRLNVLLTQRLEGNSNADLFRVQLATE